MSVAAALAEAHHHSAPKVGAVPNDAPRSQKTARASGEHPGVLKEPVVQLEAATVGYVAHHSFDKVAAGEKYDGPRAQKTDRAGEAANRALRRQRSKAAGDAVFFEFSDEDTAGVRPEALAELRPQERVQRHTVGHIVDSVRFAPMV